MSSGRGEKHKRVGKKPRRKGDASDVTTKLVSKEPVGGSLPPVIQRFYDSSSTEVEVGKRSRLGSPKERRAAAKAAAKAAGVSGGGVMASAVVDSSPKPASETPKVTRPRKKPSAPDGAASWIEEMKEITRELMDVVFGKAVGVLPRKVLEQGGRYETLLMKLLAENERLRGRLDGAGGGGITWVQPVPVSPTVPVVPPIVSPVVPAVPVAKPVETWSVVLKGCKTSR